MYSTRKQPETSTLFRIIEFSNSKSAFQCVSSSAHSRALTIHFRAGIRTCQMIVGTTLLSYAMTIMTELEHASALLLKTQKMPETES